MSREIRFVAKRLIYVIRCEETNLRRQRRQNTFITQNEERPTRVGCAELRDDSEMFLSLPSLLGNPRFPSHAVVLADNGRTDGSVSLQTLTSA